MAWPSCHFPMKTSNPEPFTLNPDPDPKVLHPNSRKRRVKWRPQQRGVAFVSRSDENLKT